MQSGDVVVFDPSKFNIKYWEGLPEEIKIKGYGRLGYGETHYFIFLTVILQAPGHCIIVSNKTGKIETMVHMSELRVITDDEF